MAGVACVVGDISNAVGGCTAIAATVSQLAQDWVGAEGTCLLLTSVSWASFVSLRLHQG